MMDDVRRARESEKKGFQWQDNPESTRAGVELFIRYLTRGPRVQLITWRAYKRALRLLCVSARGWYWEFGTVMWKKRLELAGLNEVGEVVDEVRWAHAIDYMREVETFREGEFRRWLEEHPVPTAVPAISVPVRPHPRSKRARGEAQRSKRAGELLAAKMREKYEL